MRSRNLIRLCALVLGLILGLAPTLSGHTQQMKDGLLPIGGFRCVDLKPLKNDVTFDLYQTGCFAASGFRQEIWKRHGVPYLYAPGTGNIRVAGPNWTRLFTTSLQTESMAMWPMPSTRPRAMAISASPMMAKSRPTVCRRIQPRGERKAVD